MKIIELKLTERELVLLKMMVREWIQKMETATGNNVSEDYYRILYKIKDKIKGEKP